MTSETLQKQSQAPVDDLERPFTVGEICRFFAMVIFLYPIFLGGFYWSGAYIYTYPEFPPLWYGFWVSTIGLTTVGLVSVWLLLDCPRVVRQRMAKIVPQHDDETSTAERLFHKLGHALFFPALLGMGYDGVQRRHDFSHAVIWMALVVWAISMLWVNWVMRTNKYAARIVVQQAGHQLVSTGPYSVVRHPMYMGIIPTCLAMPLTVGSVWPIVPLAIFVVGIALRTYSEEEFLVETFGEEYQAYRQKVPYRMIPFVF